MNELVKKLLDTGVLRTPSVAAAISFVDRADFVPKELHFASYADEALPIGHRQTISQPYTVAFMLELLEVFQGSLVADIGYGSGWQTAILAKLAGGSGHIYAFEIVCELCEFGKKNVGKYQTLLPHISFFCKNAADERVFKKIPRLDRIIAAAELREVPAVWRNKLSIGGIMVYPKRGSIFRETKKENAVFSKEEYQGFAFVPFVEPKDVSGAIF